jgi:hypothetical protein
MRPRNREAVGRLGHPWHRRLVRRRVRPCFLALGLLVASLLGCAGSQAYVDWRPGLSAADFDGSFEIPLDEYERFADQAEPHTLLDRQRGDGQAEAAAAMAELGGRLASGPVDPRGYAIVSLGGDGKVRLLDDREQHLDGTVDWFAITPDRQWAALLSGDKLAVVIGQASAGVDLGSLLGGADGHHFMMMVDGDELTVFALPEIGNAVAANETGFVLSFRHQSGGREPWDITVARVAIAM